MKSETHRLFENFINYLTDEPNPKVLYHFTRGEGVYNILKRNELVGMDNYQVSFTSDETYAGNGFQPMEKTTAVLVFDARKLAQDYTIERYVYNKDDSASFDDYVNEYEWVIENKVENILDYLIFIGDNGMYEDDLVRIEQDFPEVLIELW